jgi:alpha-L-rhamnosidase
MLYDVLRWWERNDLAYTITNQKDYPGYIYMLENGATTLWEHWEIPEQNSLNHPMFGSVSEWFYRSLAGINPDPLAAGFDKIIIKPFIVGDLRFVKCNYHSVKGPINSSWERSDDHLNMLVQIPPNVHTHLYIPTKDPNSIYINGISALTNADLKYIDFNGRYAIFETGNGSFEIRSDL